MGSDNPQKVSPSPPLPLTSSYPTRSAIPKKAASLRVRPKVIRSGVGRNASHHSPRRVKDECFSALLPVLTIAAVWCLGCYIYLWISLYRSFSEDIDDHGGHMMFNKRKDILAIKLEQFLVGTDASVNDASESNAAKGDAVKDVWSNGDSLPVSHHNSNSSIFDQIGDPIIAKQIQSTLMSKTGYPNLVLGAYLEPPLPPEEINGDSPLTLRTQTPQDLTYIEYPYQHMQTSHGGPDNHQIVGACSGKGAQWTFPTFHPKALDKHFESNVFKKHPDFDKRWELASGIPDGSGNSQKSKGFCPVDADPYLPWIHDAFPSNDGRHVDFIISNKRRCNTDPNVFQSDLKNLVPQVALMQPIPAKRMQEGADFSDTLEKLWSPDSNGKNDMAGSEPFILEDDTYNHPRYILAPSLDDADEDGKYTRFICRFHTIIIEEVDDKNNGKPSLNKRVLGETFSSYTYNPEHANYAKRGSKPMLTSLDQGHDEQLWNSIYSVRCPVPQFINNDTSANSDILSNIIASGMSVIHGTPSLYLDLIPIRTPVRTDRRGFGLPGVKQSQPNEPPLFDPKLAWGDSHVLPRVEASGRWANIPICLPPKLDEGLVDELKQKKTGGGKDIAGTTHNDQNKTHFLVACVWASQSFPTRGQTTDTDSSTSARLREFLAYHTKVAGFDHIYVYDNSDTTTSNVTLEAVTDLFSPQLVTRVPWPHRVCNNNRPMHSNPGFRSSQYAAENSCRARYGPTTTWMASLNVDEYIVPTGKKWNNLRQWLEHVTNDEKNTQILSFYQTRALPNVDLMVPFDGKPTKSCEVKKGVGAIDSMCLMKNPESTFMETYNCEPTIHPKPKSWAWRAKKQIYRPSFVLNHFVHYSVVTRQILDKPMETSPRFAERSPFERRVDELKEAFLLHTKTTGPDMTAKWTESCHRKGASIGKNPCKVGIPSQETVLGDETNVLVGDGDGPSIAFESNCYRHSRVMTEWVPKLEAALQSLDKHLE